MQRETIGVDLDDVLCNNAEAIIDFSNANYGTSLKLETYGDHWAKMWGVDHQEAERRAIEILTPERVAVYGVKKGAHAALEILSEDSDVYIITARLRCLIDVTHDRMNYYFPGLIKGIHFVPIWEPNNQLTKADFCRQIGAGKLTDDLAKHCNIAAQAGIRAFLFGDYNWNHNEPIVEGVTRCANWDQILAQLGKRALTESD
jgi:5'(3')-deoxyribonucleotidase